MFVFFVFIKIVLRTEPNAEKNIPIQGEKGMFYESGASTGSFDLKNYMRHINAIIMFDKTADGHHAIAAGNTLGRQIGIADDRINFGGVQRIKGVIFTGDGSLGGVALMPESLLKQISYLEHLFSVPVLPAKAALPNHFPAAL